MSTFLQFQLCLLFSPIILLGIHAVASRTIIFLGATLSPQAVAFLSVGIGYGVIGFLSWGIYFHYLYGIDLLRAISYMLLVYAGFSYSYFHIFNMSETARRIKILSDLLIAGPLDVDTVRSRLTANEQISVRMERLLSLRQVKKVGDRYLIRGRSLWLAAVVLMWFRGVLKL
jgi:hypothetical protein